jgi:hypothetical protein
VSDTTGGASSATGRIDIRVGDSESVDAVIPWISGKAAQTMHCKLAVRELSDGRCVWPEASPMVSHRLFCNSEL